MNQQQLSEAMRKFQDETTFPPEKIMPDFETWKHHAMRYGSPKTFGMYAPEFEKLYNATTYNIYEVSVLLNLMANRSMEQLGMTPANYFLYQRGLYAMGETVVALVTPEQERLQGLVDAMFKQQQPKGKKGNVRSLNRGEA